MKRFFYWKVKKIRIIDITFMGMILAMYVVLNLIAGYSIPPFFIVINIQFVPLFILACYTDWLRTLIVVCLAGLIAFFMPANVDRAIPLAYVFDYLIPLLLVAICSLFLPREFKKYNQRNSENTKSKNFSISSKNVLYWIKDQWLFILIIFVYTFLGFISKTIGGVLFYSEFAPENKNIWVYSMSVNIVNSSVDLGIYLALIPIICYSLKPLNKNVY